MSVIGFDIGNESCVIAAAKRGGIDVLLNDESKRETPSVVSFGAKQRFLGSAGAASATANPKSTISQVKRLIGRVYKDPSVQEDLKLLPFVTSEGPRGGILIELEYLKKKMKFTPVEILGMLFTHLKQIAEKNLESDVIDCVIGVPSYFTDLQRREYLDAALIAGLNPLRLMHDCTATALGYGMYKTDFLKGGPTYVIFVDIGHCDTQVTVAGFREGQMKIFSHSFDQNLGGRDFDEVLFKYFAAQFKEKHNIDVYSHARASIRLRASCEKVKKVLSANAEAPLSIDCLIGDQDVREIITREEFENLSSELLERVTVPCSNALKDSGISIDEISTIELVGSGSRIPAVMKRLTFVFQKEPTRTLNASECVARGCALRCAMLSPTQKVRNYKIQDVFPYSIGIPVDEITFFAKGKPFPNHYKLAYSGINPLRIHIFYTDNTDFPTGISRKVGHFMIGQPKSSGAEQVKFEFKVKLNEHGIVEIESVSHLEDKRPAAHKSYHYHPDRMVAGSKISNLCFSSNLDVATTKDELHKAQQREKMLAEQDIKVEQAKGQRNTLESFVYDTRSKLLSTYQSLATDSEKEIITNSLQETEDWLYEDSDDESEQEYTGKLKDLQKLLDPIEIRYKDYKEEKAQEQAIKALRMCIEEYRLAAESLPPCYKQEVKKATVMVEQWFNDLFQHHSSLNNAEHVIWSTIIKNGMEVFQRNCIDIIGSKPSFPNHDKPMHLEQRDQPIVSNQREQPVDSDQREQPVDPDQREQPNESDQREQPVKSRQSDQPVDSNESDQYVDQRDRPVDSNQRDRPVDSNPRSKPTESNQINKPADLNQRNKPVDPNQRNKPVDPNQRNKPVVLNQRNKPVEPNQMEQAVALDQRNKPVDSIQRNNHVDSNQRNKPMVSNQRNKPPVGSNQMKQAMESDQHDDMRID